MNNINIHEIYFAGGCLWGVQEYIRHLPGVITTESGRVNGVSNNTLGEYDGYAECVRTEFDAELVSVEQLIMYFFEIIDPYSINKQGPDTGKKYRTGIYSQDKHLLTKAKNIIFRREDAAQIAVEVLALSNYVKSDDEHQDRLTRCPDDLCHIPTTLLHKYKK